MSDDFFGRVSNWLSNKSSGPPQTLEDRVKTLKEQAKAEEARAKLIAEGVEAKRRIAAARLQIRQSQATAGRGLSNTRLIVYGIIGVVLIIIIASTVHC